MPADRNLLFGILAVQMGFVRREALISAFQDWLPDQNQSLTQMLLERDDLRPDHRDVLEALVEKHVEAHGGDAGQSLASLTPLEAVRGELQQIGDPALQSSLSYLSPAAATPDAATQSYEARGDPYATLLVRRKALPTGASTSGEAASGKETAGRFQVLRPHAQGGLGQVFVALDRDLHREVALKEMHSRHAGQLERQSRFVLEAIVTGGLEHPGIVPVYALGQYADGRPYYAMRFIRGDSLAQAIARLHKPSQSSHTISRRALDLRQLLGRLVTVCNAVAYAHSRGVLHRDIKPENIMLGPYGETLVVDWGLAKALGRREGPGASDELPFQAAIADDLSSRMGQVVGTPQYMPPEAASGRLELLGAGSDVYSLGATLYSILTGEVPFEATDVEEVIQKVKKGKFRPPRQVKSSVPAPLDAICCKAMALQPKDRYAGAIDLASDLERWLADEPVTAYSEPLSVRAGRSLKRHRVFVSSALATGMVAVIGLMAVLGLQARANRELRAANDRERERFTLAMEAIGTFHTGVSQDLLLKQKEFDPLRKKLLRGAADFYRKLETQVGDQHDRQARAALGRAYVELGQLTGEIGSMEEALAVERRGLDVRRALAEEAPADDQAQADVALSLTGIGNLLAETDKPAEARETYERAGDIYTRLIQADPDVPRYRRGLASVYKAIGNSSPGTMKPIERLAYFEKSRNIDQELAGADPGNSDLQLQLAKGHKDVATMLSLLGKESEALASNEKALAIYQKLADARPDSDEIQLLLAKALVNLGFMTYYEMPARSLPVYEKARTIFQRLVVKNPAVTVFQENLGDCNGSIADALAQAGKPQEALAANKQSLAIFEKLADANPTVVEFERALAARHLVSGDIAAAASRWEEAALSYRRGVTIAEALVKGHVTNQEYRNLAARGSKRQGVVSQRSGRPADALAAFRRAISILESLDQTGLRDIERIYNLACYHALVAGMASISSSGLSREEGAAEEEKAMSYLHRVVELGFRNVEGFRADSDLESLRKRADFQKLLSDLEPKEKPPKR